MARGGGAVKWEYLILPLHHMHMGHDMYREDPCLSFLSTFGGDKTMLMGPLSHDWVRGCSCPPCLPQSTFSFAQCCPLICHFVCNCVEVT
jgi:hypothetical protein